MAAAMTPPFDEAVGTPGSGEDQRIILNGMSWKDFEVLEAVRGAGAGVRMYYLRGRVELMSPSEGHEGLKKMLARLLEAWTDHHEIELNGFGSWTMKSAPAEVSAEPDECYVLDAPRKDLPDLALEVAWTRGGLEKLDIYLALGVREVWMIDKRHEVLVFALRGDRYEPFERSELLPALDLVWLASFRGAPSQSQAVRQRRAALKV